MPFGPLLLVLACVAVPLIGLGATIYGLIRRRRAFTCIGAVLCAVTFVLIVPSLLDADIEWNPHINDDASVVGTWTDERETITLLADHTFDYSSAAEGFSGRWHRDDWNLYVTAKGVDSTMRFIGYHDELRLITKLPDDHTMLDAVAGLRRR